MLMMAINGNGQMRLIGHIRQWVILGVSVVIIAYGLLTPDAPTLMLGCTMLGTDPLVRASKEPPPP